MRPKGRPRSSRQPHQVEGCKRAARGLLQAPTGHKATEIDREEPGGRASLCAHAGSVLPVRRLRIRLWTVRRAAFRHPARFGSGTLPLA